MGNRKFLTPSEFSKNVLTLMTGTTIAQAIPIAFSPILTRIYTPENFGVYSLFMAITMILGSIANGRYELAIMLPEREEDAINIFALGLFITLSLSGILLVLVILFNENIATLLQNEEIGTWLYFVPLSVLLIGLFNILSYFNNRKKYYKDIAGATITKSIILAFSQLSIGFLKLGAAGLVSGNILSQLFANKRLLRNVFKNHDLSQVVSREKVVQLAKRYVNFPKFSMWAVLANSLSQHVINLVMPAMFNIATLGFYSLVQRMLAMPATLIGSSIAQVFFQEATKEKQKTGTAAKTFRNTTNKLLIIGIPAFSILFFIVEELFALVFGENWRIAGTFAKIVTPLYFIRFIASTVSTINIIYERQAIGLIINILLFLSSLSVFYVSHKLEYDIYHYLYLFTAVLSVEYTVIFGYYRWLSKKYHS